MNKEENVWTEYIEIARKIKEGVDQRPDEITRREFMEQTGMSKWEAISFLDRLIAEGKAEVRKPEGTNRFYYRILDKTEQQNASAASGNSANSDQTS